MRRGLTLIELIVVIAIIALIIAILIPVLWNVRKRSYESACISNLRQIYVAFEGYRQDHNEFPPDITRLASYIKEKAILRCPADVYPQGAGHLNSMGLVETSYFYFLPSTADYLKILQGADSVHGILVCVLHGNRVSETLGPAELTFAGKVLRLTVDGSVQSKYAEMLCFNDAEGNLTEMRHPWYLFSDVRPIPEAVMNSDPALRGANIVPCGY
jgi:prepilin-type N-terminal cleavage/methylation domain-containing protein